MSLPLSLKPKGNYALLRVGPNEDGGYLVGKKSLANSKYLISFGIFDDWIFEKDFLKKNDIVKINCYDDVLSASWLFKNIFKFLINLKFNLAIKKIKIFIDYFFIKKKINFNKKEIISKDLIEISKSKKDIFLKIDIEGSEYRILNDILDIEKNLLGMIIEFHDVDLHLDKIENFVNSLKYLKLIHIHPNNYGKLNSENDPTLIEVTFEKDPDLISEEVYLPNNLDYKNRPNSHDIELKFNKS